MSAGEALFQVYSYPDLGYAPDAERPTLDEAHRDAEARAKAKGFSDRQGWNWEREPLSDTWARWTLCSVADWAYPTGVTVEGPIPPGPDSV